MNGRRRFRLSYANVVSSLALFAALGGSSYAAISITGKQVRDGSLGGLDVRNGSLTSQDVRDRSLLARDFKAGQLPTGSRGPKGAPGTPGTPGGYTKAEAEARFLPLNGKAADAKTLDGIASNGYVQGNGDVVFRESLLTAGQVNTKWMAVGGIAHLQISCAAASEGTVKLVSDNSGDVHAFANAVVGTSASVSEYGLNQPGAGVNVLVATSDSQVSLQVLAGGGAPSETHLTTLVISVLKDVNGGCRFVAHSVHSSSSGPLS